MKKRMYIANENTKRELDSKIYLIILVTQSIIKKTL